MITYFFTELLSSPEWALPSLTKLHQSSLHSTLILQFSIPTSPFRHLESILSHLSVKLNILVSSFRVLLSSTKPQEVIRPSFSFLPLLRFFGNAFFWARGKGEGLNHRHKPLAPGFELVNFSFSSARER